MSRVEGLRDFLLVWAGQLVSGVGSRLTSFALGVWVLRQTGSTTQFAMIFVAMAIPALVASPFAGALVDRWDRRRTMIACEAVSAAAMIGLAVLLAAGHLSIPAVYAGVGIVSLANAFLQPAYAASVPLLATEDRLTRVNGLIQTGVAVAQVGGPLLAGLLISSISLHGVLMVDAATFAVGALALVAATVPSPEHNASADERGGLWSEAATGFRYVRRHAGLLGLLLVFGVTNFLFGIASIAITPLVLSLTDARHLGFQMAVGGAGLLVGGLVMSTWAGPRRRVHGILGGTLLAGLMLAVHGVRPSFALLIVAGFGFFLSLPLINACNAALWQSRVPIGLQGRCFAIQRILSESAMPIGYCIAGPLAEHVFEPLLMPGGALASSVGRVIGMGPGRGIALMFILIGLLMMAIAGVAYALRSIRCLEDRAVDAHAATESTLNCFV